MSRILATLALATTALLLPATPAQASPFPPAPCTSAEVVASEWSQLAPGQSLPQVQSIVGSAGTFVGVESGRHVYRWTYCANGWRADLRLPFFPVSRLNSQPILASVSLPGR